MSSIVSLTIAALVFVVSGQTTHEMHFPYAGHYEAAFQPQTNHLGMIYETTNLAVHADDLNGWTDLGGAVYREPIAIRANDGTVDVFVLSYNDNRFWYRRTASSIRWLAWARPAVLKTLKGSAATGGVNDRAIISIGNYHDVWISEYYKNGWRGYKTLPMKSANTPAVAGTDDGTFYYFAVGFDGIVCMTIRKAGQEILPFIRMEGITIKGDLTAVAYNSVHGSHVLVFGVNIGQWYTGYLFYAEIINGRWDGKWVNTNQFSNDIPSFATVENGIVMTVSDGIGGVLVRYLDKSNGWSDWINLNGRTIYRPAVASTGVNTTVFIVSPDRTMYYKKTNDLSSWSDWISLSGPFTSPPAAVAAYGNAMVFALGERSTMKHYLLPL